MPWTSWHIVLLILGCGRVFGNRNCRLLKFNNLQLRFLKTRRPHPRINKLNALLLLCESAAGLLVVAQCFWEIPLQIAKRLEG